LDDARVYKLRPYLVELLQALAPRYSTGGVEAGGATNHSFFWQFILTGKRETVPINSPTTLQDVEGAGAIRGPAKHILKLEREMEVNLACDCQWIFQILRLYEFLRARSIIEHSAWLNIKL
jgi:hypothetical protein